MAATTRPARPAAAGAPAAEDVLGRVTLVTGKEEFLGERVVAGVREACRAHDPEAELSETMAGDLTMATLGELAAPSLFSTTRCVVVRKLEDLPDESVDGLLAYAGAPADDVALVLVHGGGQKGSGVLARLRKARAVVEHKSAELKPSEVAGFVSAEVRRHGGRIDREACEVLVEAIGRDLRALSGAAAQLAEDFPGETLTEDRVKQYFGGRAEVKSFAVADLAFAGQRAPALEALRWGLDTGLEPVLVTSAFAGSARALARYLGASSSMRDNELAALLGVPPWKIRTIRDQARSWTAPGVIRAIRVIAQADADIKGAAHDSSYTLERMVLTITGLRHGH